MIQIILLILRLIPGVSRLIEAFAERGREIEANRRHEEKDSAVDAAIDDVRVPQSEGQRKTPDGQG